MKKIWFIGIIICLFCITVFSQEKPTEKPPLTEKDLEKLTYYFEIENDKFVGDGAKFLLDELTKHQYVLLGEYHGSYQISKFTKVLIPVMHDAGCRTFGLEIGPVSAEILTELSKEKSKTLDNLKAFNSQFLIQTPRRPVTPIPFFSYVEDAEFLAEARQRNWNLLGLDQENSYGYSALIHRIYENLGSKKKTELKPIFNRTVAQINEIYKNDAKENYNMYQAILDSKEINEFFTVAVKANPKNQRIVDHLKISVDIYNLFRNRRWYDNNSTRINTMKKYLTEGFSQIKFDLKKDKMLLKMGGVHTGRGFSLLSLFELGNTLSELAEFNGNRSLHLDFSSRFYMQNGQEIDVLNNTQSVTYNYQPLLQMSKKDKWTVIDLRPLQNDVFYRQKYKLDWRVLEIFKNHDLYVMPPIDKAPTPNFVVK